MNAEIDLFGEQRVQIRDNPLLQALCEQILDLVQRKPEVLNGDKVGQIDRQLMLNIWYENGLNKLLSGEQWAKFCEWAMNPKTCPDPEAISRGRRYLAERDLIRLPQTAIQNAERDRQRIARSVK